MCSQSEVHAIVRELSDRLKALFPEEAFDVILFGSWARSDAEEGSDIDVLFLVDASRQGISEKNWQIGEAAAEMLLEHGVVVSPIVENREYYRRHIGLLPLFRNIQREGVRIGA